MAFHLYILAGCKYYTYQRKRTYKTYTYQRNAPIYAVLSKNLGFIT